MCLSEIRHGLEVSKAASVGASEPCRFCLMMKEQELVRSNTYILDEEIGKNTNV